MPTLDAAFDADFDAIGELFATDDVGVAVKLDALLAPYLDSDGVFDSRTSGLEVVDRRHRERREALNKRLAALQTRYTQQFNALDSLLSQLQGTSNFLDSTAEPAAGLDDSAKTEAKPGSYEHVISESSIEPSAPTALSRRPRRIKSCRSCSMRS